MSNAPLPAVLRICDEALAREGAERDAYLDSACGADGPLREEVESLLQGQGRLATFLDNPPWGPEASTLEAGRRLGPYEIVELIGAGGMGAVYRARDTRLGRTVAVKVIAGVTAIHPAARERFAREAQVIASLNHPHICALHDLGRDGDLAFLVMECLEGRTLADALRAAHGRAAPFKVEDVVEYGIQIAEGLAAAHAAGIVHRDLKPSNVMLTPSGVKLLDFGLAKRVHDEAGPSDVTMTLTGPTAPGAVLGTVGYTSPEQARGEPVDARSDIFSFGCVLYEMLSGTQPFLRRSRAETTSALLTETPPPPGAANPLVPASLDAIVLKALEKDRELRYQSGAEIRTDLLRVRRELTGSSNGSGAVVVAVRRRRPRWVAAVAAAVLAATALVAGGLALLRARDALPPFEPRRVTAGLESDSDPALSPDGNFLAYASEEAGNQDVWLLDLRNGSTIRRTSDPAPDRRPTWMPNGAELLFVSERDGTAAIWRMPALDGPAVRLIPDADDVAVSPDGREVAFTRLVPPGETRIAVAPVSDASRVRFVTRQGDGRWDHAQPAWSPDGAQICYRAHMSLWKVPAAGGRPAQVLADNHYLLGPAWSHDGRHIYFSSNREGSEAIWRVDADGRNIRRVTGGTGPEAQPVVSQDGRVLALATRRDDFSLVIRDVATGREETWSTSAYESMPSLAPDGRTVFFQSNAVPPNPQLWSLPLLARRPAGRAVRLTGHDGLVSHPAVSPDGQWVAYSLIDSVGGRRRVWAVPSAGGPATQVTDGPDDTVPEWMPDARHLLFRRPDRGVNHIWRIPFAEGRAAGPAVQLTTGDREDGAAVCAPDGSAIAFVREGDAPGRSDVWVMPANGRGNTLQVTSGARAHRLRWEPGNVRALLVTGMWGGSRIEMRRVTLEDGASTPVSPPVLFGPSLEVFDFTLSEDGGLLAYARNQTQGNIWIARARRGRF